MSQLAQTGVTRKETMSQDQARPSAAFASVTTLFFAWGFVTATIDPLVPSVRAVFSLSYAESMLTQFAFFLAYGLVSLPAAGLVARLGYWRAIIAALAAMVAGCLVIPLATSARLYVGVLAALFIIASGITLLQVAANPLAAAAGPPGRSHLRLTLAQAFNSLGTVLAPYLGAMLLLRGGLFAGGSSEAGVAESLRKIDIAFLAIAGAIVLLGAFIWWVRGPLSAAAKTASGEAGATVWSAFRSPWALAGAAAIFLYVGAEVSIGSLMINFLERPNILGVRAEDAGRLLSLYWLGAMVGRFIGSALLARVRAGLLLAAAAAVAASLCLVVTLTSGLTPAIAALAVGLFNSIMFPTIFTLTLERSSAPSSATAGVLCVAIVGGAALPVVVGHVADAASPSLAFAVPMIAYVGVALFAVFAARGRPVSSAVPAAAMSH
jgi:FHS family L-fucose permease-like MFS transporter